MVVDRRTCSCVRLDICQSDAMVLEGLPDAMGLGSVVPMLLELDQHGAQNAAGPRRTPWPHVRGSMQHQGHQDHCRAVRIECRPGTCSDVPTTPSDARSDGR